MDMSVTKETTALERKRQVYTTILDEAWLTNNLKHGADLYRGRAGLLELQDYGAKGGRKKQSSKSRPTDIKWAYM